VKVRSEDEATDNLIEAVYRRAFPGPADEILAEARRFVIQERLGLMLSNPQDKLDLVENALKPLGFDTTMQAILLREKTLGEISLFNNHAYRCLVDDIDRASAVPPAFQVPPGFPATFNQAMTLTDRDLAAISRAVKDLTGSGPSDGRLR
jgi:hypothetical protein